jgi:hypothetical protein
MPSSVPARLLALVVAAAAAAAASFATASSTASSTTASFISNTAFRTTPDGQIVGAQDGNIVNVRVPLLPSPNPASFVLVGILYGDCPFTACANQSQGACGFSMGSMRAWASPDLSQSSWTLLPGEILPASERPQGIYFRPHVVFNAATQKFVLWVRWLNVTGPTLSDDATLYLTATSDAVDGPYTVVRTVVPMYYNNSADDNLFVDPDDGAAYIAHTCRSCGTHIVVERLSDDYTYSLGATDPTMRSALVGPGSTEAPALFKVNGTIFLSMTPLCCFCTEGSQTLLYASTAGPLGPYAALPSLGNAPKGQQNFVFTHPDVDGVLWSANRWGSDPDAGPGGQNPAPIFDHSLQFWTVLQPASGGVGFEEIEWVDNFTVGVR